MFSEGIAMSVLTVEQIRRRNPVSMLVAFAIFSALTLTPAWGLDQKKRVSQYIHTSWKLSDGALSNVPTAIVQTSDGYLWVGTQSGLQRFDGVRFIQLALSPSQSFNLPVYSLLGASDGSLWIGTESGIARWSQGKLTTFSSCVGTITSIAEDKAHAIWFTRVKAKDDSGGLCSIASDAVHIHGTNDGIPFTSADSVLEAEAGTIWVGSSLGVARLRDGVSKLFLPKALKPFAGANGVMAMQVARDGAVVIGTRDHGKSLGLQELRGKEWHSFDLNNEDAETLDVLTLLYDRDGGLWIGTENKGLYHFANGYTDHFDASLGLSGNAVQWISEDREGSIWVTTPRGIDRFRSSRVTVFSQNEGLLSDIVSGAVAPARDGGVWVGQVGGLIRIKDGQVTSIGTKEGFPGHVVGGLLEDHEGKLWVGTDRGLFIYRNRRFAPVLKADGVPVDLAAQISEDREHNIWVNESGLRANLLRADQSLVVTEVRIHEKPERGLAFAPDPRGGIWLGFSNGDLATLKGGMVERHSFPAGLRIPRYLDLLPNKDGSLWAASTEGLIGWRSGTWRAVTTSNGLPCRRVNSLLRDGAGSIWGSSECGILRISENDLDRLWANPQSVLQMGIISPSEGAQSTVSPIRSKTGISRDGTIWFASANTVQAVDPTDRNKNNVPPPVHIEDIITDGAVLTTRPRLTLHPLVKELQIDYTALSLAASQRVLFRYKLDSHDDQWQDAGTRRQAFYNNLAPGAYTFRVMACNNDGVWNVVGDSFTFVIPPVFYQTLWFRCCCLLGVLLAVWLIFRMRVQAISEDIHSRLAERLLERERIARELHDTLLQGFQGVILRFETATRRITADTEVRGMLDSALDRADEVLVEGRRRVGELRSDNPVSDGLLVAFRNVAALHCGDRPSNFEVTLLKPERPLHASVEEEIYWIGREAILNSLTHSEGTAFSASINYSDRFLTVHWVDNGRGIDPQIIQDGRRIGHWKLFGMKERAGKIGGDLLIKSANGNGTTVELRVPAQVAYGDFRYSRFLKPIMRLFKRRA